MVKFRTGQKLLQFIYNSNEISKDKYSDLIAEYCKTNKLVNAKAIGDKDEIELSYYVGFKDKEKTTDFFKKLREIKGISNVNLFYDEEYF